MKTLFHHHFKKTDREYQDLWNNAVFCLDTNILLNLYRYSDETKDQLLNILTKMKLDVWVPYWVGMEFFKNRLPEISKQIASYDSPVGKLKEAKTLFAKDKKHPIVSEESLNELTVLISKIEAEVATTTKTLRARISDDEILDRIGEIAENRIGAVLTDEVLKGYMVEGEIRLPAKIPPGFVDYKERAGERTTNPYAGFGDMIIWFEMIEKAKEVKKPVIFISDDQKEDWILEQSGLKQGPLPALRKEFFEKSDGQEFHMYTATQFVRQYESISGEGVAEKVIEELKGFENLMTHKRHSESGRLYHIVLIEESEGWKFHFERIEMKAMLKSVHFSSLEEMLEVIDNIQKLPPSAMDIRILRESFPKELDRVVLFDSRNVLVASSDVVSSATAFRYESRTRRHFGAAYLQFGLDFSVKHVTTPSAGSGVTTTEVR